MLGGAPGTGELCSTDQVGLRGPSGPYPHVQPSAPEQERGGDGAREPGRGGIATLLAYCLVAGPVLPAARTDRATGFSQGNALVQPDGGHVTLQCPRCEEGWGRAHPSWYRRVIFFLWCVNQQLSRTLLHEQISPHLSLSNVTRSVFKNFIFYKIVSFTPGAHNTCWIVFLTPLVVKVVSIRQYHRHSGPTLALWLGTVALARPSAGKRICRCAVPD